MQQGLINRFFPPIEARILKAIESEEIELLKSLLFGKDINQLYNGQSLLHTAALLFKPKVFCFLLEQPDINPNIQGKYYYQDKTILATLCMIKYERGKNHQTETFTNLDKLLLHPDLNINETSDLLHDLCYKTEIETVLKLLQHKDILLDNKDSDGNTPLHHCIYHDLYYGDSGSSEHSRVNSIKELPQARLARALLEKNMALLNMQNNNGKTFLHVCVEAGEHETVKLLLTYPELDVNIKDNLGKTALHYACEKNMQIATALLLSHSKTDIHLCDSAGQPAYGYLKKEQEKIISLFAEKDILCQDRAEDTITVSL